MLDGKRLNSDRLRKRKIAISELARTGARELKTLDIFLCWVF
jgi:hypothetical protein